MIWSLNIDWVVSNNKDRGIRGKFLTVDMNLGGLTKEVTWMYSKTVQLMTQQESSEIYSPLKNIIWSWKDRASIPYTADVKFIVEPNLS